MNTDYLIGGVISAVIAALALFAMYKGWQRRSAIGMELAANSTISLDGELLKTFENVLYVVTHEESTKLERVALPGLKYRGYATVAVLTDGIMLLVTGEEPVAISGVNAITTDNTSLAKVVEKDGLTSVHWSHNGHSFVSVLRFADHSQQQEFINLASAQFVEKRNVAC